MVNGMPIVAEAGLHSGEVSCRVVAVEVGDAWCAGDDLRVTRTLRIEHTQRVLVERRLALGDNSARCDSKYSRQRGDVPRPIIWLAQRVEPQRDLAQSRARGRTPSPSAITSTSRYGSSAPSTSMPT